MTTTSSMTKPCSHDWIRYTLNDSAPSHAQKDDVDTVGRPYRDLPMWPASAFAHAATIGSDFAARVVALACADCGAKFDAGMARIADPMPGRLAR